MPTNVVMEALSPTMEEGRLVEWKKQEGDTVAVGDVLAEVETDKAVMELVARASGTLLKHIVEAGSTVPVSEPVAVIGQPGEDSGTQDEPAAGQRARPTARRRRSGAARTRRPPSLLPVRTGRSPCLLLLLSCSSRGTARQSKRTRSRRQRRQVSAYQAPAQPSGRQGQSFAPGSQDRGRTGR